MRDIAEELAVWCAAKRRFALATVIGVSGSAPRPPGTAMAVDADGLVVGGVSGGCVEAAVYERCREVLHTGVSVVETFGYSDADAFAVGLTCGGTVELFVCAVDIDDPAISVVLRGLREGTPVALIRVIAGAGAGTAKALAVGGDGSRAGGLGDPELDAAMAQEADEALTAGRFVRLQRFGRTVMVEPHRPPPRLLVFGAADFTAAVVRAGKFVGFHVTVCDARPVFATAARFPEADKVVIEWPHRYLDATVVDPRTAICVLTHDAKFDIPLLERALRRPAGYVGAMGSRRTHLDRLRRLREAGLSDAELSRLHSPIGLDLGGRSAEETALSILAEIVALRHGAAGGFLSGGAVPIHKDPVTKIP